MTAAPVRQVAQANVARGIQRPNMPKTAKNIWNLVFEWENLLFAAKEASRNKRYRSEVIRFNARLEENLLHIRHLLYSKLWRPGHIGNFTFLNRNVV